jgi:hypothetical protein
VLTVAGSPGRTRSPIQVRGIEVCGGSRGSIRLTATLGSRGMPGPAEGIVTCAASAAVLTELGSASRRPVPER